MFNLIQNNGRSIQHRFLQRYIFCFSKKKKKKKHEIQNEIHRIALFVWKRK